METQDLQETQTVAAASATEELSKDNFEALFGDTPLVITDSEVKD